MIFNEWPLEVIRICNNMFLLAPDFSKIIGYGISQFITGITKSLKIPVPTVGDLLLIFRILVPNK
jgi:hypothetical protein